MTFEKKWKAFLIKEAAKLEPPESVFQWAEEMLETVSGACHLIGDTALVDNWSIETHTYGCRNAAGTPEKDWEEEHWEIHDEYANDGTSIILYAEWGDAFATLTPNKSLRDNMRD